jgi:DNA-binding NtrC family response regulator
MLKEHEWPGNVRELRNVIERGLIFTHGEWLEVPDPTGGSPGARGVSPADAATLGVALPVGLTLEEVERRYIRAVMEQAGGNVAAAAETLGVSRKVLWSRRRKYGLLGDGESQ